MSEIASDKNQARGEGEVFYDEECLSRGRRTDGCGKFQRRLRTNARAGAGRRGGEGSVGTFTRAGGAGGGSHLRKRAQRRPWPKRGQAGDHQVRPPPVGW